MVSDTPGASSSVGPSPHLAFALIFCVVLAALVIWSRRRRRGQETAAAAAGDTGRAAEMARDDQLGATFGAFAAAAAALRH